MKKLALILFLSSSPALAQQASPAETALQINAVIGQWVQTITAQAKVIEQQQAEIKELKAKLEEKPNAK